MNMLLTYEDDPFCCTTTTVKNEDISSPKNLHPPDPDPAPSCRSPLQNVVPSPV